jgi:hypothetical protein
VCQAKNGDPSKCWFVTEGALVCAGTPEGFCYTEKTYKNYAIRFDWRFRRPEFLSEDDKFLGRGGLLLHIQNPTRPAASKGIWPRSVMVEGSVKGHGRTFTMGGVEGRFETDLELLRKARKPIGEWNSAEVVCRGRRITVRNNGTEVTSGWSELTGGHIGFVSDGWMIGFRNIRIKELEQ